MMIGEMHSVQVESTIAAKKIVVSVEIEDVILPREQGIDSFVSVTDL